MFCQFCGAGIDHRGNHDCSEQKLDRIEREVRHNHAMLHEILKAVVIDPAQLKAAQDAIETAKSDTAGLKAAIDAAPKS